MAAKLREEGIGKGANVPIVAERGIPGVCAMIGVLRAGAAFCYISTDYPQEHVEFIKKDVGAVVTIDDEVWKDRAQRIFLFFCILQAPLANPKVLCCFIRIFKVMHCFMAD